MIKRKNARSAVAAAEQAIGKCAEADLSIENYTSSPFVRQVSLFIPRGAENAIPARGLARRVGYRGERALRLAIERERREGAVILADDNGYYLPSSDAEQARREIERFVRRTDARMRSNRESVRSAKRFLRRYSYAEIEGQEALPLD